MAILTDARRALWTALEHWPELQTDGRFLFRGRFAYETDNPLLDEVEPSISDLPALEIVPASHLSPAWDTNTDQGWPYALEVKVWLPGWVIAPAEELLEQIARAAFQSAGEDGVSHIKAATGFYPRLGPLSIAATTLKDPEANTGVRVTLARLTVILRTRFKPFH